MTSIFSTTSPDDSRRDERLWDQPVLRNGSVDARGPPTTTRSRGSPTITTLTGISPDCPTDPSLFRDDEEDWVKEMDVQVQMDDFLEGVDYSLTCTPPWMCDYYSAHDSAWDVHDLAYHRFLIKTMQENDPRIVPFGMQVDGDISVMEAEYHWRYATKTWHDWIEMADKGSSTPITEPWQNGIPQFTNYAELKPPSIDFPTQSGYFPEAEFAARAIGHKGDWVKRLTHEAGLHYIQYDKERKVFQLWGASNLLGPAKVIMHRHFFHTVRKFDREMNGTERKRWEMWNIGDEVDPVITMDQYAQLWGPHDQCYNWNDLKTFYLTKQ